MHQPAQALQSLNNLNIQDATSQYNARQTSNVKQRQPRYQDTHPGSMLYSRAQ